MIKKLFKGSSSTQSLHATEREETAIEGEAGSTTLLNLNLNLKHRDIYHIGSLVQRQKYMMKTWKQSIPIPPKDTQIRLFTREVIESNQKAKCGKFNFTHIGAVEVVLGLLMMRQADCKILCILQDKRQVDFETSLLGAVTSDLSVNIVHFTVIPDLTVAIEDSLEFLVLRIQSEGVDMIPGSLYLAVEYKVFYKLMEKEFPNTKLKAEKGMTTLIRPSVGEQVKNIWSEMEFPEEWKVLAEPS